MNLNVMCCGLLLSIAAPAGGGAKLAMQVSPSFATEPAIVRIRVSIERDADNRSIEVVAESGDYYRASATELEGERAPVTAGFEYRNLPAGAYDVRAALVGSNSRLRALVRQQVTVLSSGR